MNKVIFLFFFLIIQTLPFDTVTAEKKWWEKWDPFPKVRRITAKQVKYLMQKDEKIVYIYSGYKIDKIVCGSLVLPYTAVPPYGDGSKIKLRIPKDWWLMCY